MARSEAEVDHAFRIRPRPDHDMQKRSMLGSVKGPSLSSVVACRVVSSRVVFSRVRVIPRTPNTHIPRPILVSLLYSYTNQKP